MKVLIPLALASATLAASYQLFAQNIVMPMIAPLASVALTAVCAAIYLAFTEGRDKRRIRHMLGQYVSPAVLTEVIDHYQDHLHAEVGREENLSILFSDIRGFTNLSEALPAGQLVAMLNYYFSKMTDAIFDHHGTVDKFIGDAIMAFWGAPIHDKAHALKSVYAAIEMVKKLDEVNLWLIDKAYPQIHIGIGINTGNVIIGNIGSERKLDYTVIGDNVNLASRLEGLTKPYGCQIIISEHTYEQLSNKIPCYVVDIVKVKGKQHPIRIYCPLVNVASQQALTICADYEQAFEFYLNKNWHEAIRIYEHLPNKVLSEIFISRCQIYLKTPPSEDWDGAHTMTSK